MLLNQASAIADGLSLELKGFELTKPLNVLMKEITDLMVVTQYINGQYSNEKIIWAWREPCSFGIAESLRNHLLEGYNE